MAGADYGRAAVEISALNGIIDHEKLKNVSGTQHINWTSGAGNNFQTNGSITGSAMNIGGGNLWVSGGYVGIGTDAPGASLEIKNSNPTFFMNDTEGDTLTLSLDGVRFKMSSASTGQNLLLIEDISANPATTKFQKMYSITDITAERRGLFNTDRGNYDFIVHGDNVDNLLFIDADADNVGIGTASPTYKLDVVGDANITGDIYIGDKVGINITPPTAMIHSIGFSGTDGETATQSTSGADAFIFIGGKGGHGGIVQPGQKGGDGTIILGQGGSSVNSTNSGGSGGQLIVTTGRGGGTSDGLGGPGGGVTFTLGSGGTSTTGDGGHGGNFIIKTEGGGPTNAFGFTGGHGGNFIVDLGKGATGPTTGASGLVGINTYTPQGTLDVSGTIIGLIISGTNVTSGIDPGHSHSVTTENTGSITDNLTLINQNTGSIADDLVIINQNTGSIADNTGSIISNLVLINDNIGSAASNLVLINQNIGSITDNRDAIAGISGTNFWTGNGDDIYNNNAGQVGIGTTTPTAKLHLVDNGTIAAAGGVADFHSDDKNVWPLRLYSDVGGANPIFGFLGDNTGKGLLYNQGTRTMSLDNGKVGIGNNAPGDELHVTGDIQCDRIGIGKSPVYEIDLAGNINAYVSGAAAVFNVNADLAEGAAFNFQKEASNKWAFGVGAGAQDIGMYNYNSGANAFLTFWDWNDNMVGMGTTNPGAKLHIMGDNGAGSPNVPTPGQSGLIVRGGHGGVPYLAHNGQDGGPVELITGSGTMNSTTGSAGVGGDFLIKTGDGGKGAITGSGAVGGQIQIITGDSSRHASIISTISGLKGPDITLETGDGGAAGTVGFMYGGHGGNIAMNLGSGGTGAGGTGSRGLVIINNIPVTDPGVPGALYRGGVGNSGIFISL